MMQGRWVCEAVHVAVLGVWLGALGMGAATAAILFPTMKMLDPRLAAFAKYDGPHWVLAGGMVGQRVFLALDIVQFACALLAGITLVVLLVRLGLPVRRWSTFVRIALLLGLVAIMSYRLAVLEPRMQGALGSYWAAAAGGENQEAARYRALFDEGHPVETRLLGATGAIILASLASAIWSGRRRQSE